MSIYWPGTKIVKSRCNDFNWREREAAIDWRTFGLKTAAAQAGAAATLRKTGGAAPVSLPGTFAPRKGGPLMKGARK